MIDTVDLSAPADTRDGLRAQASALSIVGRGAMNKAELTEAVTAAIAARNTPPQDVAIVTPVPTSHTITVEVSPDVASVIAAALEFHGTRSKGKRKGTGLLRTREGRKTYPARKRTGARKGGRK